MIPDAKYHGDRVYELNFRNPGSLRPANSKSKTDPDPFKTPAPQGVDFLGGMEDLPAVEGKYESHMGYFDAHLKPGTYAFIAEVPAVQIVLQPLVQKCN